FVVAAGLAGVRPQRFPQSRVRDVGAGVDDGDDGGLRARSEPEKAQQNQGRGDRKSPSIGEAVVHEKVRVHSKSPFGLHAGVEVFDPRGTFEESKRGAARKRASTRAAIFSRPAVKAAMGSCSAWTGCHQKL